MGRNKHGKGDDFLEGRIADENLGQAHTLGAGGTHPQLPITLLCGTVGGGGFQIPPGCCWTFIATTDCTTSRPNGTTCCWRILSTTDCTTTRAGEACCWIVLYSTDCTTAGGPGCDCSDET